MDLVDGGELRWVKARRSYATSSCVELAISGEMIALRDSKNPGVRLFYTQAEIAAFIDGAKNGEFDFMVESFTG
jgi:Domain of unknown function (DUF397)